MRHEKWLFCSALIFAFFSFPLCADNPAPPAARSTQPLFYIERSKNANEVHYEAHLTCQGALDVKKPVHAFWINWAKDTSGKNREELNPIEKQMAFGFSVNRVRTPDSCTMKLVCCPDRPIKVSLNNGIARAETAINGQPAYLEKIKVVTKGKQIIPQVVSVTVIGKDSATGNSVQETIIPH